MKKKALWYEKSDGNSIQCLLCPHNCKILPGKRGVCKVRHNDNGILYTLNYKKVSSMAMDPVEKKPLYHFHRGKKILSVGTFGCNFRCDFCQNYQISQSDYYSSTLNIENLISICKRDPDCVGIAYTYNEPTIWYEFVIECGRSFREAGLANVLVTNGYINIPPLKELLPYIDAMNIDVKSMNEDFYKIICGGRPDPVIATVEEAVKKCHVEVTNLIIPTQNDSAEEMTKLSKWLASLDPDIPLHLSRYFPRYNMDLPPTDPALLFKLKSVASKYLNHVYIGNVPGIL